MSWSITIIGKPEKVVEELERQSNSFSGQSKDEYNDAKSELKSLVKQNYGNDSLLIKIEAMGHGCKVDGVKQRMLQCSIDLFYGVIAM